MAFVHGSGMYLGTWGGVATNPAQLPWLNTGAVPQYEGAPQNIRNTIAAIPQPLNGVAGAKPNLQPKESPTAVAITPTHDFHERIWLFPQELILRNPVIGTLQRFQVWNTFLNQYENEFVTTLLQDLTGIENDIAPGSIYRSLEQGDQNLWLTDDAGNRMNGFMQLVFTAGTGAMRIIVDRASIVPVVPDSPVAERWTWSSQIIESENGTEQRVSLSQSPRRETDFNLTVIYPDEANAVIKQLFGDSASSIVLPQYQYLAGIKEAATAGSTTVIADPTYGDLRPGSDILFYVRNVGSFLNTIQSIDGDVIQLEAPLEANFKSGTWLVPISATYLERRTQFERAAADGYATLTTMATDVDRLTPFVYEPRRVELETFNGLPIIQHRPLVTGGSVAATYDSGINKLDYGNKVTIIAPWAHTQIELEREYLVDRFFSPADLNEWRSFFDYCRGRVRPFYTSTYRPDLVVSEPPVVGAGQLVLADDRYSAVFFGKTIADQIAIYTKAGVHYTTVLSASSDDNGQDTISLGSPLPGEEGWNEILKISFVLRCRLASDTVELEHFAFHTYLRFNIRTTDQ